MKIRYDLSKKKGCNITSVTMIETTGEDEEVAAGWAKAKGDAVSPAEELVRISICEVNDASVEQPFMDFNRWNTKTRSYVLAAWKAINIVEDSDLDDFLKTGLEK